MKGLHRKSFRNKIRFQKLLLSKIIGLIALSIFWNEPILAEKVINLPSIEGDATKAIQMRIDSIVRHSNEKNIIRFTNETI